jgi:hypothetical protein
LNLKRHFLSLVTGVALVTSSLLATSFSASAELQTSRGFGVSLNTNYGFRRIDGEPRMSVYQTNPNDEDQHFDWSNVPGGQSIRHRSTGKCLNAYRKYAGAEVNVWSCNSADPDQIWQMIDKGNGYVLWRLKDTNLCLTADTPVQNESRVALQGCAYGGPNGTQDWIGSNNPNSPVYGGGQQPVTSQYEVVNDSYEVVLNSIRPARNWLLFTENDLIQSDESGTWGHSWITLVKKYDIDTVSYRNGQIISRTRFSTGLLNYTTISASGFGLPLPEYNNSFHRKLSSWFFINRSTRVEKTAGEVGTLIVGATKFTSNRLISYLPVAISKDQYLNYIPNKEGGRGLSAGLCNTYQLLPDGNPKSCSCGVFATRLFHDSANTNLISGSQFIGVRTYVRNPFNQTWIVFPIGTTVVTPTGISKEIDKQNGYSDWNIN